MALSINGNNLIFTGTVTVVNGVNPTNGVCTLVLTPSGGVGTLPALLAGQPGQSPLLTLGTVTTLTAGSSATVGLTQTSAGGAGVSSAYTVNFGIPQGVAGTPGSLTIGGATDLSGTAAVGDIITVNHISGTTFQYSQFPFAAAFNPSTINNISTSGIATQTLCSVSIPAQPYRYVPFVFVSCITVGTANTIINMTSNLNTPATGQVLGVDYGLASTATQKLKIIPSFAAQIGSGTAPGYGEVAANTSATVYVSVGQTAGVSDAWSVSNTTASCTVGLLPVAFT
jgi:hypothetical protein